MKEGGGKVYCNATDVQEEKSRGEKMRGEVLGSTRPDGAHQELVSEGFEGGGGSTASQ